MFSRPQQTENQQLYIPSLFPTKGSKRNTHYKDKEVQICAENAIAGVRGTTYRMNVNPERSVVVQVYWGEIHVSSPSKGEDWTMVVVEPKMVEGPHPVEGPRPVSMREWTRIVRAMHQITIRADGTVSKPFRFDPRVDADDWVRWNRMRDQMQ